MSPADPRRAAWDGIQRTTEPDLEGMRRGLDIFLSAAGFDAGGEVHLQETARRVAETWADDLLRGYRTEPYDALGTPFDDPSRELVLVKGIEFFSSCPHHLMPYRGTAYVAYMPAGHAIGFSGIVRLLDNLAHRLTLQEWLTRGVTGVLDQALDPQGSACLIDAEPMCVIARGVKRPCNIVTTSFTGVFRQDPAIRHAFFDAAGIGGRR
ncbi:MAG: GTP cyclohydrolase I [Myxococcota bacterium]|jgi:GTP cyclohydrolase I|nr:GTP cyclohydrolase I [Myxococcota bacterium]